jgi:hypothetical protein
MAMPAARSPCSLTRRYHTLLVAPVEPPLSRILVLAKANARFIQGGAIEPRGHLALSTPASRCGVSLSAAVLSRSGFG